MSVVSRLSKILFAKRIRRKKAEAVNKKSWFLENEGSIVFFFPCKREIQDAIFKNILPYIDQNLDLAFHNGPKVNCTLEPFIEPYFLKNAYNSDAGFELGTPAIIQLVKGRFVLVLDLKELLEIDADGYSYQTTIDKINTCVLGLSPSRKKCKNAEVKFIVQDTFSITNRGFVLAGSILSGEIKINDILLINGETYFIKAIEFVDRIGESTSSNVGIVIDLYNEAKIKKVKGILYNNSIVTIVK